MMHVTNNESIIELSSTPKNNSNRPNLQPGGASPSTKFNWPKVDDLPWDIVFVISCAIAVSLDPLFFYIPYINEENKCLGMHKTLRNVTLVLRLLTDTIFVVHIIHQIRQAINSVDPHEMENSGWGSKALAVAGKLSWHSIVTDILSVLPIPQVLLVVVFFKLTVSKYMVKRKVVTCIIVAQYLPRIYRIRLSANNLSQTGIWAKSAFNFFLYILASHVLGAFWYFFSLQQATLCWYEAINNEANKNETIKNYMGTDVSTFYCGDLDTAPKNIITLLLHNSCPINVSENTPPPFDFGIFLDSLQKTESLNFSSKFFYSFWWGLRNLSNLGTNLTTSTYVWENSFAILISIIGLLLFLYFIGNVQAFMQSAITKSEEIGRKMKDGQIEERMKNYNLPNHLKRKIRKNIKQILKENLDADLENLFSILPPDTMKPLKRFLFMGTLKKVPMLKEKDEKVLEMICDYLRPEMYDENKIVVQGGHPLDKMIFITEGCIDTYVDVEQSRHGAGSSSGSQSSSVPTKTLENGDFYGEELLNWAPSRSEPPKSPETVKCRTKVQAFVLMAIGLKRIVSKYGLLGRNNMNHSNNNNNNINVTDPERPLMSGIESSTASTRGIRYHKPAVRPH